MKCHDISSKWQNFRKFAQRARFSYFEDKSWHFIQDCWHLSFTQKCFRSVAMVNVPLFVHNFVGVLAGWKSTWELLGCHVIQITDGVVCQQAGGKKNAQKLGSNSVVGWPSHLFLILLHGNWSRWAVGRFCFPTPLIPNPYHVIKHLRFWPHPTSQADNFGDLPGPIGNSTRKPTYGAKWCQKQRSSEKGPPLNRSGQTMSQF